MYLELSRHIIVMPVVLSMAQLNLLGHNDQIKEIYDFLNHVMSLVPVVLKCDAKCIINDSILCIRARQVKQGME